MEWTTFTADQWTHVGLYLTGLFASWGVGLKCGAAVRIIFSMGKSL